MERKILVYGNPDKRPYPVGFENEDIFQKWITQDIFMRFRSRYHYTQGKEADIIVLSREGLAFGHFEINRKEQPDQKDYEDYGETKFVYVVQSSALYGKPVPLLRLGIKNIQFGRYITEATFDDVKKLAGDIQEHRP
jgi:hypothetical protein